MTCARRSRGSQTRACVSSACRRRASSVRGALAGRIRAIAQRATMATTRPRVITLEWLDPLMIGGTWMPELVELVGGMAIGAFAGEPAPTITREQLTAHAPDVVVMKPCGFDIERSFEERSTIAAIRAAVPNARVYLTDGNAFFNRPGPRLVESLEILAELLHPTAFCFGHEGTGWERAEEAVVWA